MNNSSNSKNSTDHERGNKQAARYKENTSEELRDRKKRQLSMINILWKPTPAGDRHINVQSGEKERPSSINGVKEEKRIGRVTGPMQSAAHLTSWYRHNVHHHNNTRQSDRWQLCDVAALTDKQRRRWSTPSFAFFSQTCCSHWRKCEFPDEHSAWPMITSWLNLAQANEREALDSLRMCNKRLGSGLGDAWAFQSGAC